MPKKIIISPPIFDKSDIFDERNAPSQVADAPKRIKTIENPATKKIELINIIRFSLPRKDGRPLFSFNSANETPDINETYPGTNGKTQGERKEINPAANAMYKETSGIFYKLHLVIVGKLNCRAHQNRQHMGYRLQVALIHDEVCL
jgi:hypothetical protein